jgi:hypothetical protein
MKHESSLPYSQETDFDRYSEQHYLITIQFINLLICISPSATTYPKWFLSSVSRPKFCTIFSTNNNLIHAEVLNDMRTHSLE